jgi:hypothetical protein
LEPCIICDLKSHSFQWKIKITCIAIPVVEFLLAAELIPLCVVFDGLTGVRKRHRGPGGEREAGGVALEEEEAVLQSS